MGCNHDCANCDSKCDKESLMATCNEFSHIKKIIGVVSGKGGVGKSLVTSLLASKAAKLGYKVGILDADITGPSIPSSFGVTKKASGDEQGIEAVEDAHGIKMMSINLLLEDVESPVAWRGPIVSGAVKQFYTDVYWGDLDYLFVDMPPGTSDVALTVYQSLPIDGVVIVTSPQDLVSLIVKKAINLAKMMDIEILGVVENMSYFKCPNCDEIYKIFGTSNLQATLKELNINFLGALPINPEFAHLVDRGKAYEIVVDEIEEIFNKIK